MKDGRDNERLNEENLPSWTKYKQRTTKRKKLTADRTFVAQRRLNENR